MLEHRAEGRSRQGQRDVVDFLETNSEWPDSPLFADELHMGPFGVNSRCYGQVDLSIRKQSSYSDQIQLAGNNKYICK